MFETILECAFVDIPIALLHNSLPIGQSSPPLAVIELKESGNT